MEATVNQTTDQVSSLELQILHLSDIHLRSSDEANKYYIQLMADLKKELRLNRLHYLVISGDIANYSTPLEYQAAFVFIDGLVKQFMSDFGSVIVVPGNHDLNWELSRKSYSFIYKNELSKQCHEGRYGVLSEKTYLRVNI
ncbi:MAG: metallophosphoesterase [Desulfobacterales bacterium]|nr:metallophosphoesterase [Desulfobacterales bacterium]